MLISRLYAAIGFYQPHPLMIPVLHKTIPYLLLERRRPDYDDGRHYTEKNEIFEYGLSFFYVFAHKVPRIKKGIEHVMP